MQHLAAPACPARRCIGGLGIVPNGAKRSDAVCRPSRRGLRILVSGSRSLHQGGKLGHPHVVPFGGLLLFFVLFLGVVRNPNVPYFLRFNALQALLTDIVVIVLSFAFSILLRPIGGDTLLVGTLSSTVVIAVLAILVFAIVECLRGREPDLPGLSQAVRMQLY